MTTRRKAEEIAAAGAEKQIREPAERQRKAVPDTKKITPNAMADAVAAVNEKIARSVLDKVYMPDGTARPRHEVERLLLSGPGLVPDRK